MSKLTVKEQRHLKSLARRRADIETATDAAMVRLRRKGVGQVEIAQALGINHATVSRRVRRHVEQEAPPNPSEPSRAV